MVQLSNPLTLEDRLSVVRLIGHDLIDHQIDIIEHVFGQNDLDKDTVYEKFEHSRQVQSSITALAKDKLYLIDDFSPRCVPRPSSRLGKLSPKGFHLCWLFVCSPHQQSY